MKRLIIGLIVVILLVGTSACATSESDPALDFYRSVEDTSGKNVTVAQEGSSGLFLGLDTNGDEAPPPGFGASTKTATSTSLSTEAPEPAVGDGGRETSFERMIVRTGDLHLVVEDVAMTLEQITQLAETYDGYVVSSNSWQDGDRMVGSISIRVDAIYFDSAIQALRGMAVEVERESTSGQDVTEEYVDLGARLSNLEASEAQLLDLMKQAGTVEEILEVQREVTSTREEIEQIKGRMQYLEQSSATSLIQVQLEHSMLSVDFQAYTRAVKEGEKAWFAAEVSGGFEPYSYQWDFGDGDTSNGDRPEHIYNSEGTFTVTLTVTDDRGNSDTHTREGYMTVLPGWDVGSVAKSIWNALVVFGRVLVNIIIFIGIFSPVWIIILIILYFAWWRRRKKSKTRRAEFHGLARG
jgi:hypothetical protein